MTVFWKTNFIFRDSFIGLRGSRTALQLLWFSFVTFYLNYNYKYVFSIELNFHGNSHLFQDLAQFTVSAVGKV